MKADKLFMADQDQWFGPLRRRPHVLTLNSTNVLNNTTVLSAALRLLDLAGLVRQRSRSTPACSRSDSTRRTSTRSVPAAAMTFPSLAFDDSGRASADGAASRSAGRGRMRSTAR